MRKNLIPTAIAFATLAFAGCSQDDVLNESSTVNKAIEFSTYVGRPAESRAAAVTDLSSFGVYAYYTGQKNYANTDTPNFMNNQEVTKNEAGKWTYSPVKYWPNNADDKVSFLAYAPYNAAMTMPTGGPSSVNFTVNQTIADQVDLLWNRTSAIDLTKQAIDGVVTFNFAHALARIGLTVQCAVDQVAAGGELATGTTVTVEKVMLTGAAHTYDADSNTYTESTTGAFYPSGVLNLNNVVANVTDTAPAAADWTSKTDTGKLSFIWGTDGNGAIDTENKNNELSGAQTAAKPLINEDNYLMIIPQEFTEAAPLYVYVQYKVTTTDTENTDNSSTITNYISTPLEINFESGKLYKLNLVLGMTSVKVAAEIDTWAPVDQIVVDSPANTGTTPAPTPGA